MKFPERRTKEEMLPLRVHYLSHSCLCLALVQAILQVICLDVRTLYLAAGTMIATENRFRVHLIATHNTNMIKITEIKMETHPIESGTEVKAPNTKEKSECVVNN